MDGMEQYLAKRKILPVHMDKLLRQMDELAVSILNSVIANYSENAIFMSKIFEVKKDSIIIIFYLFIDTFGYIITKSETLKPLKSLKCVMSNKWIDF